MKKTLVLIVVLLSLVTPVSADYTGFTGWTCTDNPPDSNGCYSSSCTGTTCGCENCGQSCDAPNWGYVTCPPGETPEPKERIVGRIWHDGQIVKNRVDGTEYRIVDDEGNVASWQNDIQGNPYYTLPNRWEAADSVTLVLENPDSGYTCHWGFNGNPENQSVSPGGGTEVANGWNECTASVIVQHGNRSYDFQNHVSWDIVAVPSPTPSNTPTPTFTPTPTPTPVLGRLQGMRLGAAGRGETAIRIYQSGVPGIFYDANQSDDGDTFNTGNILTPGASYDIEFIVPGTGSGYLPYTSSCINCTTHNTIDAFCEDGTPEPCYSSDDVIATTIGQDVIYRTQVALPTVSAGSNPFVDLRFQLVPQFSFVGYAGDTISPAPGAVGPPTAPSRMSGLLSTQGGRNFNNAVEITYPVNINSQESEDVGVATLAFVDGFSPEECEGNDYQIHELKAKADAGRGFLISYVHNAEGAPLLDFLQGEGFYLYANGAWQSYLNVDQALSLINMGHPNHGIIVQVLSYDVQDSNIHITYDLSFFNDGRGNRTWTQLAVVSNSTEANSGVRTLSDACSLASAEP